MDYRFQVNLTGIIDLLSKHTYSSPQVFIRELLQNASDAILARTFLEPEYQGEVHIELQQDNSAQPVLIVRDSGIGLTEDEVHLFLATIGQTSKRAEWFNQENDFIGQFGIGLLSCFLVSDEVQVVTRSAHEQSTTIEWCGRTDGTYSLTILDRQAEPGTEVRIVCKIGSEEYFQPDKVVSLAHHYASLLRFPITYSDGENSIVINDARPPWESEFHDQVNERAAYLAYGYEIFKMEFFDYIVLRSTVGKVAGVAYVLPFSPSLAMKKTHRVYLKDMLLSEQAEGLLPDWAFFVKCVVNARDLRPTASREAFYEDETLAATRAVLGGQLRNYLIDLAENDPHRLRALINLHHLSFKALAVDDDDFFKIFMKWLPFDTNMGMTTLTEYIQQHEVVNYVDDFDQFRQIAAIAAAQSICVINAGHTYEAELVAKTQDVLPSIRLYKIDADTLLLSFKFLTIDEQSEVEHFLTLANEVLEPFRCAVEIRSFEPSDLPALYSAAEAAVFRRSIDDAKQLTKGFWSSVLDDLSAGLQLDDIARLCFNYSNPVLYKLASIHDEDLLRRSIQLMYVQAVLLSHRPLNAKELTLLNEALLGLIQQGADILVDRIQ